MGRPKRSENRQYATSTTILSRCPNPNCLSTDRSAYQKTERHEVKGMENGMPYNAVVWKICRCLQCGQWRKDRAYEFCGSLATNKVES